MTYMTEAELNTFIGELEREKTRLNGELGRLNRQRFLTGRGRARNAELENQLNELIAAISDLQTKMNPATRASETDQQVAFDKLKNLEEKYEHGKAETPLRLSGVLPTLRNTLRAINNRGIKKHVDHPVRAFFGKALQVAVPLFVAGVVLPAVGLPALSLALTSGWGLAAVAGIPAVRGLHHTIQGAIRSGVLRRAGTTYDDLYPTLDDKARGWLNKFRYNRSKRRSIGRTYQTLHTQVAGYRSFKPGDPALRGATGPDFETRLTNAITQTKAVDLTIAVQLNALKAALDALKTDPAYAASPNKDLLDLCIDYVNLAIGINGGSVDETLLESFLDITTKRPECVILLNDLAPKIEQLINDKGLMNPHVQTLINDYHTAMTRGGAPGGAPTSSLDALITAAIDDTKNVDLSNAAGLAALRANLDAIISDPAFLTTPKRDQIDLCSDYVNLANGINGGTLDETLLETFLERRGHGPEYLALLDHLEPKLEALIVAKGMLNPHVQTLINDYHAAISRGGAPGGAPGTGGAPGGAPGTGGAPGGAPGSTSVTTQAEFDAEYSNIVNDLRADLNPTNIQRLRDLVVGVTGSIGINKGTSEKLLQMLTAYTNLVDRMRNGDWKSKDFFDPLKTIMSIKGGAPIQEFRGIVIEKLREADRNLGIGSVNTVLNRYEAERHIEDKTFVGGVTLTAAEKRTIEDMRNFDFTDFTQSEASINNLKARAYGLNTTKKNPVIESEIQMFRSRIAAYDRVKAQSAGLKQKIRDVLSVKGVSPDYAHNAAYYHDFFEAYTGILTYVGVYAKAIAGKAIAKNTSKRSDLNEAVRMGLIDSVDLADIRTILSDYSKARTTSGISEDKFAEWSAGSGRRR